MIETYNIITIGVLDEDKKLVGITEENFKNLLKKAEKLDELQTRMKEIYGEGEELLETFVSGLEQYNSQQEEHPFKARLLTNETVDEWEAYQRAKSEERLDVYKRQVFCSYILVLERYMQETSLESVWNMVRNT